MKKLTNGIEKVLMPSVSYEGPNGEPGVRLMYIVWWHRHIELFAYSEEEAEERLAALVAGGDPDEVADKQIRGEL